jgi:hypothetical protein
VISSQAITQFDYSIAGKWLALLKEIAPNTTRAAVLRDPAITAGIGQWATIQSVSSAVGIEVRPISLADADEMESAIAAFARSSNGGLIATGSALTIGSSGSDYLACRTAPIAGGLL